MAFTANMEGISRTRQIGTIAIFVETRSPMDAFLFSDFETSFFNTNEFGTTVRYTHYSDGNTEVYQCLKDDPTQDVRGGSKTQITGYKPCVTLSTAHMKAIPNINDTIAVNGVGYMIDSIDDDGLGVVTIYIIRKNQRQS